MIVFRIVPMDCKGIQDGSSYVTSDRIAAMKAKAEGHAVFVTEVEKWRIAWEKP